MKSLIKNILIFILLIELLLQSMFFFKIKSIIKPVLFFNPYCDERYWKFDNQNQSLLSNKVTTENYLTYINKDKKSVFEDLMNNKLKIENENVFYGASFFDHKYFKINNLNNNNKYNFALNSYGIDQIYISFIKTIKNISNSNIVLGILLEDIDRAFLNFRDYQKNYKLDSSNLQIVAVQSKENHLTFNFYFYNFVKNIFLLYSNNFNPRNIECKKKEKIKLFEDIMLEFDNLSKKHNNNLLVVTFNLEDDFKKPSWRNYHFKKILNEYKINNIDSLDILKNYLIKNNINSNDLYGNDRHFNEYTFGIINNEISNVLSKEQYK